MLLDGDQLRHGLCGDLGFSPAERAENIRRAGEAARLVLRTGQPGVVRVRVALSERPESGPLAAARGRVHRSVRQRAARNLHASAIRKGFTRARVAARCHS